MSVFDLVEGVNTDGLNSSIAGQAGALTGALAALDKLRSPQDAVGALLGGLQAIPGPKLNLPSNFTGSMTSLRGAVPSDLSAVTGDLTGAIGRFGVDIDATLIGQIGAFKTAIEAIYKLSQVSFSAPASGGAPAAAAPAGGAAPASAGGAAAPSVPAPQGGGAATPSTPAAATPATPTPAEARIQAIQKVAGVLAPVGPLDVPKLLELAKKGLAGLPRDLVNIQKIPFLDDLIWMLTTVCTLREQDAAALRAHVQKTVEDFAAFLAANAAAPASNVQSQFTALASHVDTVALRTEVEALRDAFAQIGARLDANQETDIDAGVARANATLATLIPRIAALNSDLFNGQVDAATRAFERLPLDLDRQMRRVVRALKPADQLQFFEAIGDRLKAAVEAADPAAIAADIEELFGKLLEAMGRVNILDVRGPLLEAVDALKLAAEKLNELMAQAAAKTAVIFDKLNEFLAGIDLAPIATAMNDAVTEFSAGLQAQADKLLEPARKAIGDGVDAIASAAAMFKPEVIVDALKAVVQDLAGALDAQEIKDALNAIRGVIDDVAAQLKTISFTPVSDAVVAEINDITTKLNSIDSAKLSTALKIALTAAVEVLPGDLDFATKPLLARVDEITGPAGTVMKPFKDAPAQLLAKLQAFSPANLIGDQLSGPLASVIAELEKFKPSDALNPVKDALEGFKRDLRAKANPVQLLAPLESAFNELLAEFEKLKPAELIKPLEAGISAAMTKIAAVIPVKDFKNILDEIVARLKSVGDSVGAVRQALETAGAMFSGLADPEQQLRAWLAPLVARVDQIPDLAGLQPAFDAAAVQVNGLKAAALRATVLTPAGTLKQALAALNAGPLLAGLTAAYGSVRRDAANAVADATRKAALLDVLARANPLDALFARPFEGLTRWLESLKRDQAAFETLLANWDAVYHRAGGPLAGFVRTSITADQIKTELRDALEREVISPLGHLFGVLHTISEAVAPPLAKVTDFAQQFEDKLGDLLGAPEALDQIAAALDALSNKLKGINLQFLVEQMNMTFTAVKGKLEAVSPAVLRGAIEAAFDNALKLLDVSQLLGAANLDALDKTYQDVIDKLKQLDPGKLIVAATQPVFEEKILPLIKVFDVTVLLGALIARLNGLKAELKKELDRVNGSYKQMLEAVPSIEISLDTVADAAGEVGAFLGF